MKFYQCISVKLSIILVHKEQIQKFLINFVIFLLLFFFDYTEYARFSKAKRELLSKERHIHTNQGQSGGCESIYRKLLNQPKQI